MNINLLINSDKCLPIILVVFIIIIIISLKYVDGYNKQYLIYIIIFANKLI